MIPCRNIDISFGWGIGFYLRFDHWDRFRSINIYLPFTSIEINWERE